MTETLDITSESLRSKNYRVVGSHDNIMIHHPGSETAPWVFDLDRRHFGRSTKSIDKGLKEKGVPQMIISEIESCMASHFNELTESAIDATIKSQTQQKQRNNSLKMAPKAIRADCSMDEWRSRVQTKYKHLKQLVETKAPGLWLPLEFVITIKCILNIANITQPVIGVVLGPASSWKSRAVNMSKGARDTFGVDSFSPKSFVSHNSNLTEEQLQEIDLLPKIKNKLFMVPELSPLFTSREEDLEQIIGMIVRIGDGEGYTSASGTKGVRGYEDDIMFCWVGAAVSIPFKIHKQLSRLGPKMYFIRMPMVSENEDELLQMLQDDNFGEQMREIKAAFFDYLECLESCPDMVVDPTSGIPKMKMITKSPEQEQVQRRIIYLAELLAHLRGTVETWGDTKDGQGKEYSHNSANIENVRRVIKQLYNFARGHALSQGREQITIEDDLPIITKVVLSGAANVERVKVLDLLLSGEKEKRYSSEEVAEAIGTSTNTALRTMVEFKALKLVEYEDLAGAVSIRMKEGFDWFFTKEFKDLKGDYVPGDFKEQLIRKKKNKDEGEWDWKKERGGE